MDIVPVSDKASWEAFLAHYSPESLFQSWNWGEVIRRSEGEGQPSAPILRRAVVAFGHWRGIFQVHTVRARRGTFLHVRHGPILSTWYDDTFPFVLSYLRELGKTEGALFVRISPLLSPSDEIVDIFSRVGFRPSPIHALDGEYCWVLDVQKTEEELLAGMRKTTRYCIRKAERMGVRIVKSTNPDDLAGFFRLYDVTSQRHGFLQHGGIREEFEQFARDDQIMLFQGFDRHHLIASALILFYTNQAIYHHSASVEQHVPVNYLLQWEVIREAKRRKKQAYNFWGIAPEGKRRHPWNGLSMFKKGFGGRTVAYLHTQDYPLSPVYYCTTFLFETIRRVRRGY